MPIPNKYSSRSFYHFTHIDNLPGLLETGLLANGHPDFPTSSHSIAESGIQARRAKMAVTCGAKGVVHDYVPFYFCARSLMLLGVIHKKNVDQCDIVYFKFPISLLDRDGAVFTDASANTVPPPNFFSDSSDLDNLNWGEIDSQKWSCGSEDLGHQRAAEALIPEHVPLSAASTCVVWNEAVKSRVKELTKGIDDFPKIDFQEKYRGHYFVEFMDEEKKGGSIVQGPQAIAARLASTFEYLDEHVGKNPETATFATGNDLLSELRKNFGCIAETADLVGLAAENKVHKETVDVHIQQVVEVLLGLPEFKDLHVRLKPLIELAAYLHDIGKGPKEKCLVKATGKYLYKNDPDHPVGAMPMIERILTEEIASIKPKSAKLIAKLVCYHDLVGDVLGKGRDEAQIVQVAENEVELKLLFLLGRADATTLGFNWVDAKADAIFARTLAAIEAK